MTWRRKPPAPPQVSLGVACSCAAAVATHAVRVPARLSTVRLSDEWLLAAAVAAVAVFVFLFSLQQDYAQPHQAEVGIADEQLRRGDRCGYFAKPSGLHPRRLCLLNYFSTSQLKIHDRSS